MDIGKLKVEIYDVLALLIPGMGFLAIISFAILGWTDFEAALKSLNGPLVGAMLTTSFALGHAIQEGSEWVITILTNPRFLKRWRDEIWNGPDADMLKAAITLDGGSTSTVDAAFDFCLSKAKRVFAKRDLFVATADFSRAMAALGIISGIATIRSTYDHRFSLSSVLVWAGAGLLTSILWTALFWRRMLRFRAHSESPVFYAYLATQRTKKESPSVARA